MANKSVKMKKVQFNLLLPEVYVLYLRKMAARQILRDPKKSCSASQIAVQIISDYFDNDEIEEEECNISPTDRKETEELLKEEVL